MPFYNSQLLQSPGGSAFGGLRATQNDLFGGGDNLAATATTFPVSPAFHNREPVTINVPSPDASTPHRRFKGEIEDFENKALVLVADEAVDIYAGLTAQGKDLMFLGGVLSCSAEPDGRWMIHIRVNRTLLVV